MLENYRKVKVKEGKKSLYRLFQTTTILLMPIIIITLSLNLVFRSEEVFSYYLNESENLYNTNITLSNAEMSAKMGDFFLSFSDDVNINIDNGYSVDPVFNDKEEQFLLDFRDKLNFITLIGLGALVVEVIAYLYMIKRRGKEQLFLAYQLSMFVTGIITIALDILMFVSSLYKKSLGFVSAAHLSKKANLGILILNDDYSHFIGYTQTIFTVILALAFLYITYKLTRRKVLFVKQY